MTFEIFISRRYFKSKPNQTIIALINLLSIIGVAIGVTALIVVIAVMGGFETDLKSRILGIEPHLVIERQSAPIDDYQQVIGLIEQNSQIVAAWPVVELQAMLRSELRVAGATIKGVDPLSAGKGLHIDSLKALSEKAFTAPLKESDGAPAPSPIVLGRSLGRTLGLIKGDTLFIISPRGALAPIGFVPFMKKFRVVDFFETGMYEYDGSLAFMNLKDAQSLAHLKTAAGAIEMRVTDMYETNALGKQLISELGPSYGFQDWIKLNKNLFAALKLEKAGMFIALTLIILVATVSIISSLVMMVMEKTKDIAIFRTLGATGRSIQKLFVYQGMLIGVIGTGIGVIMGTLLCLLQEKYHLVALPGDVYYITALPVNLRFLDVATVAASALFICFLSTLYPARQAAQLNPVEAIRYG
ncbi:MAG: lipoprotein-releasing ABC transporter permease subunit [Desulfobacteraceae bacterium]|jgi:lipoprotein-releasing system permease protein